MIDTKRKELEDFIQSQMEGPGGCANKFYLLQTTGEGSLATEELLNATPGMFYSTAILFPRKIVVTNGDGADNDEDGEENSALLNSDVEENEDRYVFGQRYPQAFGISCCISSLAETSEPKNVKISISGRYYTKVKGEELDRIVVRVDDIDDFKKFVHEYCAGIEGIISFTNDGVHLAQGKVSNIVDNYGVYSQACREINKNVCKAIADNDAQYDGLNDDAKFLSSYKERLWHKLHTVRDGGYVTDIEKNEILNKLNSVEQGERYIDYIEDLIDICDGRSFGFWQSHSFDIPITISYEQLNIVDTQQILSANDIPELSINLGKYNDIERKLEVLLQVTKDAENDKLYLKVQLVNKTTPFEESGNRYYSIVTEGVNKRSIFGARIKVESDMLVPYKEYADNVQDQDQQKLDYLYRGLKSYGVGHLCSVEWDKGGKWVKSEFIPSYEVPDVEPIPRDNNRYIEDNGVFSPAPYLNNAQTLEFKWLSTFSNATNADIINGLYEFVDAYKDWIDTQRGLVNGNPIGEGNLSLCENDYTRMRSNIEHILAVNDDNIETFRIMNSAMYIQFYHTKHNSVDEQLDYDYYRDHDCVKDGNPIAWRAFQLAFILLNLDGIIQRDDDPEWKARSQTVDLVWFPTGGGKTEAYLGIIALAIIHRRRIAGEQGGGTTILMRYTLRLLAIQQFQRAMRLILALEQIRKWNYYDLGNEQISIGLYVGDSSLPNSREDLRSECGVWNTIINDKRSKSRIPIDRCPYCGERLTYTEQNGFYCQGRCIYNSFGNVGSLPLRLCDEDIYSNPPTLLFGTVDKFAMLGHSITLQKDSRRIFGVNGMLLPSLIIQDELHLLLGPLGSAVGLFEKAIDQLCSYEENGIIVRPKIISSTATTRNTDLQIRALYDRSVNIFPKPGATYDDSFYSFYRRHKVNGSVEYISKRKYVGIMPTGRTQMTTQMRLFATILVHRAIFERDHKNDPNQDGFRNAMDSYYTAINYFNSLKEVGKVDAQFHTEFLKYTRRLFKRVMRQGDQLWCWYLYDEAFNKSELTGRKDGSEVVGELSKINQKWNENDRYPHIDSNNQWQRGVTPPDMVLATNMISVGIDVERFNTMLINSMPRNFAEYIQASSRVARSTKGLVLTLHNPYRVRDLSHFERFREFHEKLYYYVEPISITPYSKRVIDKYLSLYVITLIRHKYDDLAADIAEVRNRRTQQIRQEAKGACKLNNGLKEDICRYLKQCFEDLLENVQNNYEDECKALFTDSLKEYIDRKIDTLMSGWMQLLSDIEQENQNRAGNLPTRLRYNYSDTANSNPRREYNFRDLILSIDDYDTVDTNKWSVPMALRNIESEAVINVRD